LLTLVMAATQSSTTMSANGVDFIHEDNARAVPLGLVKQIAHAARAYTHEHFDKFRTADAEERHAGLARNCLRQQALARAGATNQKTSLWNACAKLDKLPRFAQEFHDFFQFFFGFVGPCHVLKCHRRLVAREHPRAALTERKRLVIRALGLPQHQVNEPG